MKRFIIIGLGIFGSGVAETLYREGHEVIAIDVKEEPVNRIASHVTRAVVGDARQIDILEKIGAQGADTGVISTGDDISASILAAMALRDLNVREIYVKVVSFDHARIMAKIGVTETVFPERESSVNLAVRLIHSQAVLNYYRIGSGLSLQEMAVPVRWEGKTLRELQLPTHYRVSVVAIHDVLTDQMIPVPDPDMPLLDTHTLVLTGSETNLARVARID
jgi:trk system potassium uptake protein TrkA